MRNIFLLLILMFSNQSVIADERSIDLSNCIVAIPSGYVQVTTSPGIKKISYSRHLGALEIGQLSYPNPSNLKPTNSEKHGSITIITFSDQLSEEPNVVKLIQAQTQYVAIFDKEPKYPTLSNTLISSCISTLKRQ